MAVSIFWLGFLTGFVTLILAMFLGTFVRDQWNHAIQAGVRRAIEARDNRERREREERRALEHLETMKRLARQELEQDTNMSPPIEVPHVRL